MGVKISDLTTESAPASTDILVIADPTTGLAKKITVSALKTYMDGLGGGSDTTAPIIVSIVATASTTVVVTFSESVTVTTAGWSFKKNGAAWTASSVSGSGATWTFTMASSALSSDTLLYSYAAASGVTVDTSANELASVTDAAITNSIAGSDSTAPTIVSAITPDANPDTVVVTFSETVTVTTAGWSFKKNGVAWSITSVSGSGSTWTFLMSSVASPGDTLLRSYNSATGATVDTSANELVSFTDQSVTNSIGFDADASAFFTATGSLAVGALSDATVKAAVNQLVLDLKAASLWTNMEVIYPFVGGSQNTMKFNLKNPADTDGAHRGTINGTAMLYAETGLTIGTGGSNTDSYINTHYNPSTRVTSLNAFAIGYYHRSGGISQRLPISTYTGSSSRLVTSASGSDILVDFWSFDERVTVTAPTHTRLISFVRSSSTDLKVYREATAILTSTTANTGTMPNADFYIGCENNNGTPASYNIGTELAFFYAYDGALNGTQMTALNTAVNTFQTALSRNV